MGAVVISKLAVEELRAAARQRLSAFKVPTLWLAVDIDQMTLAQLDLLEENLRRLPV